MSSPGAAGATTANGTTANGTIADGARTAPVRTGRPSAMAMTFRDADVDWLRSARRAARAAAAPARSDLNHAEAVELVAAELLANAFAHGAPPVELLVVPAADGTHVEVRDAAPRQVPRPPTEAWRGMGLIQNLTTRLDVVVDRDCKVVVVTVPFDAWARHRRAERA